ncbi:MAG: HDIG domain-containing protein [Balneolaceae bacterium]|nr:HDIG domain-containing protein [Balneolaceae bacterium]
MNFLEKIGLGQKKKELTPLIGEKKKKEQEAYSLKRNPYIRFLIFLFFILICVFSLPKNTINTGFNYVVNQPWRAPNLTAPFNFAINKTGSEIEQEREQIRAQTPPIYRADPTVAINIQSRMDSLYRQIQPVLQTYHEWQTAKEDPNTSDMNDSLRFAQAFNTNNPGLTENSWNLLLSDYHEMQRSNQSPTDFIGVNVKQRLETIIEQMLNRGIINRNKANLNTDEVIVRNPKESTEQSVNLARLRDLREANQFAQFRLNTFFEEQSVRLAMEIYNKVIEPNYRYSEIDTRNNIEEALSTISDKKGAIAQGQVIIRRGDIVTAEKANIIESLAEARAQNASDTERWIRYAGQVVIIVIISFVFFMYIYLYRRSITSDNSMFLLVFLTMGLICMSTGIINHLDIADPYVIPIAIAPIILTIIFDSRVGLIATVTLASILGLVNNTNFEFVIATFAACSLGVFSVRDIRDRAQFFFTTPGVVFITYILIIGSFNLASLSGWDMFLSDLMYIAISSVFILFTYPLILLFEKIFGVTTDFTLLELGDTNQPLLKELMNKAPGTFHHSLQVANLSEAAASAIGANSLLCRVGALYHDIGKMVKPEYYVENQSKGSNEHDKLKPQMSAMVIKAHVTEGAKMARKEDLPQVIIDFIKTHHGTSFIRYFYEKAKEDEKLKNMLNEEQFRYDGPLPFSKETGILSLADGIEAASRAMKNPTYSKLENLVNRMVDERVNEGQLSHCPLTFRHLQIIKETFLNILVGVYHSRVEYPDDKEGEEINKEKLKEAPGATTDRPNAPEPSLESPEEKQSPNT